jgi:hypothetical protein
VNIIGARGGPIHRSLQARLLAGHIHRRERGLFWYCDACNHYGLDMWSAWEEEFMAPVGSEYASECTSCGRIELYNAELPGLFRWLYDGGAGVFVETGPPVANRLGREPQEFDWLVGAGDCGDTVAALSAQR